MKEENVPKVYGVNIPPEWKLQEMYKQLKVDNNNFITWLVESVYPNTEGLPSYITVSRQQAKGQPTFIHPAATTNLGLLDRTDYPKYEIVVKFFTQLARQTQNVPSDIVALLDRLIDERTEYSYWMSLKLADSPCKVTEEKHAYYVEILKDTKTILAERMVPAAAAAATQPGPFYPKMATTSFKPTTSTLGKRKSSSAAIQSFDQRKAAKMQESWRQTVTASCDKTEERSMPVAKPTSYAAVARVAVTA